jgi:hypothetical protein
MEIFQIGLLIGVFLLMALLMFLRKIPALLALPIMAFLIAIFGGVSLTDTVQYVIGHGALKLHTAYTVAIFGSMLSVIMQKTGVAESFIKKGAELSGDNPWIIAVIMLLLIAMLFTTMGGLGAIIMVATIVLPIMAAVGIGAMTTVGIFLLGLSIGGILNVGNWAVYVNVLGLTVNEIRPFALVMFAITITAALFYITIQLFRDGQELNIKKIVISSLVVIGIIGALVAVYYWILPDNMKTTVIDSLASIGTGLNYLIGIVIIGLFVYAIIRLILRKNEKTDEVHWTSYLSPVLPLFLILFFDVDFIASFVVGLIYCFVTTYKKGRLNVFIQSVLEGGGIVMPAVVMLFGIGMLLVAIMGPGVELEAYPNGWPVLNLIRPAMKQIVPTSSIMYVVVFTILAPLALYRGPFNVWGMGYGLAAVFLASGLNPGAVMGLLLSMGQVQGVSDPTNTHNVWLANEMRVDVQKVLKNTIPFTWIIAFLGLICSAIFFL